MAWKPAGSTVLVTGAQGFIGSWLAERGEIGRDERVVLVITGEGLKTLDAVRGSFETIDVEPTVESFASAAGVEAVAQRL